MSVTIDRRPGADFAAYDEPPRNHHRGERHDDEYDYAADAAAYESQFVDAPVEPNRNWIVEPRILLGASAAIVLLGVGLMVTTAVPPQSPQTETRRVAPPMRAPLPAEKQIAEASAAPEIPALTPPSEEMRAQLAQRRAAPETPAEIAKVAPEIFAPPALLERAPEAPTEPPAQQAAETPVPPAKETQSAFDAGSGARKRSKSCYVKIDGRVVFKGACGLRSTKTSVAFDIKTPVTITLTRGNVWRAKAADADIGKVFKRGACWGNTRAWICEHL